MVLAVYKNICKRASSYLSGLNGYWKRGHKGKIKRVKKKRATKAALILKKFKSNTQQDNQDADVSAKLEEGRHNIGSKPSTSDSDFWPPKESDDLHCIHSSLQQDGLDDALFNSMMKDIFGPVSKKGPPPSTLVTPKHLHQLEAFRKQVPQSDRSYVEVWIQNLKPHEKKEGSNIT